MNILLLRFSAMGDVALLAPVVQALTARYPDAQVTVLTRAKFAPFFSGIPNVRVVGADFAGQHNGLAGLVRLFGELRQLATFDIVADAHQNLRSAVLKNLFRLSGVRVVTIDKGRAEKKALTRKANKVRSHLPHTVERYARLFDAADLAVKPAPTFRFANLDPSAKADLSAFLDRQTLVTDAPWLGIAPFAQHAQKMWPFSRYELLLEQLYARGPLQVFLFGGGDAEIRQLDSLRQRFPQAVLVAGQLSLSAELQLIARLDAMLCMDSGNMHLAALSGVPVVSIWGSTHPDAGFGPWGQSDEAIVQIPTDVLTCRPCSVFGNKPCWRGDLACLNNITVAAVAGRILERLNPDSLSADATAAPQI
ncbi:glycosyltransferase family 9 protein [Spirosoma montaniterrae]|uniref:Glycosyl transferase n=1 Tax=Spirosoma montaniterrae TaxID=1178516 RepID=A0A1P9WVQ7_9BACT|nr:glycosyltransferase family 9 protein [Spirosoma montaniterrae]AQG79462.1 glycosyl transferase [Spirosoma montaniterrae]